MYKKIKAAILCLGIVGNVVLWSSSKVRSAVIAFYNVGGNARLSYSTDQVYDLNTLGVGQLSAQVNASTVTTAASTFTDGGQSTGAFTVSSFTALTATPSVGTLTISSNSALAGKFAYDYVRVASNTALTGRYSYDRITVGTMVAATTASIIINGMSYESSTTWNFGASTRATAANLVTLLNNTTTEYGIFASTTGWGNIIDVYAINVGQAGNLLTMVSSTQAALTVATTFFTGGQDPVSLRMPTFDVTGATFIIITAGQQFQVSAFSSQTAYNLAQMIDGLQFGITASTGINFGPTPQVIAASSITVIMNKAGSVYNQYVLTSSSQSALEVKYPSFIGGQDPVTVSVNGVQFKNTVDWITGSVASNSAQNLFFAISSNALLSGIITSTASEGAATGRVTLTSISSGSAYTYPLFTSSQTAVTLSYRASTVSGSTTSAIQGGRDNAVIGINGVYLRQGTDWFAVQNNTQTAASISDAIMRNSSLKNVVMSTWSLFNIQQSTPGVIYSTSISVGASQNFALYTSTQPGLSISSNSTVGFAGLNGPATGFMCGGADVNYSSVTDVINLPNNTLGTGMAVIYSTGGAAGGTNLDPLRFAATYFVILVDTSNIKLALTSSGAVAGIAIDLLTKSTQTITHTFTLTPISPLGNSSGWWQVSNDSATWTDVANTTVTMVSPTFVSTSAFQNIGVQNFRYQRFHVNGSTSGAINWKTTINGKSQ
jgi:hypothetical protein